MKLLQPCGKNWKKLLGYDRTPLIKRLMERHLWSYHEAKRGTWRYLMFLFLVTQYPCQTLVPTQEIDVIWHEAMSITAQYRTMCQELCGGIIEHVEESEVQQNSEAEDLDHAFTQTKLLAELDFGVGAFADEDSRRAACCHPDQAALADGAASCSS